MLKNIKISKDTENKIQNRIQDSKLSESDKKNLIHDLKKYQNIKEILKIICYGLLIIAFFYLAGHAIGKGWAYYTQ